MTQNTPASLTHLRRLTNPLGLVRAASGGQPDRLAGYSALDNADALRLCATASDTIEGETLAPLAQRYYGFLCRGRRADGGVHHACDAIGQWSEDEDDALVQSRLARALSAVMVSQSPIKMRLAAADWWSALSAQQRYPRSARAAANWLIAMGQLGAADPGRDLDRAEALARWLIEECHDPIRCGAWEWFEPKWTPTAACIPAGLWYACEMLGDERFGDVARVTTQFLIDHLFEDGLFLPVGNKGGWTRYADKAVFDQLPMEACSVVELLCAAEQAGGCMHCSQYADYANRWFSGNNVRGVEMIDPETHGCYDAICSSGLDMNQGGSATVSYLLSRMAIVNRPLVIEEPTIYASWIPG